MENIKEIYTQFGLSGILNNETVPYKICIDSFLYMLSSMFPLSEIQECLTSGNLYFTNGIFHVETHRLWCQAAEIPRQDLATNWLGMLLDFSEFRFPHL